MSTSSPTTLDLESPENLAAVRREWTAERVGWGVATLALLAASLGVTGPGLLSNRIVSTSDGALRVRYSAMERYQSPTEIEIVCRPHGTQRNIVIRIARSFVDRTSEPHFTPAPLTSVIEGDAIAYTFATGSTGDALRILLRFQYTQMGRVRGDIQLADNIPVSITQVVLP